MILTLNKYPLWEVMSFLSNKESCTRKKRLCIKHTCLASYNSMLAIPAIRKTRQEDTEYESLVYMIGPSLHFYFFFCRTPRLY